MSLKSPNSGRPSTTRIIPPLPDFLWSRICRFLTDEQVRGMYSINRSLYSVAMTLRYQRVSVGSLEGADAKRCLFITENAELRGHVRSLSLYSTRSEANGQPSSDDVSAAAGTAIKKIGDQLAIVKVVVSRWKSKVQSPTSPIAPQFQISSTHSRSPSLNRALSLSRRKTRDQALREAAIAQLASFLGRLPKLTDLTINFTDLAIEGNEEDVWSLCLLPQFRSGAPYATSLRSLTLSGSITAWRRVIPPHHEWPHLEKFSVIADAGYRNAQDDTYALRLELAPFVRRHSKTLKAVSLRSTMKLDLASLYDGMGWLPRLEWFEIEQPYLPPSQNHSDGLNQFLLRHRDTLQSFKWIFVNPSGASIRSFTLDSQDWFEQPPYHLTLPSLRQLHLAFPDPPNSTLFEGTLFYCARHASMITHLSLKGLTFTLPQFHELLLFVGSKHLEELDISLDVLTSAVFSNLSMKFPALKTLHLSYTSVGRQKSVSESTLVDPTGGGILKIPNVSIMKTWQFRQDMAVFVLPKWSLLELYLSKDGDRSWREYKVDQVGKLVAKGLPKVEFINDMYREVFLQL